MSASIVALDFLAKLDSHAPKSVCVVFGDDAYLKRQVVAAIRQNVLTTDDAELSLCKADGSEAELRDVMDELSTMSMFGGGQRLVIVEDADSFVSRFRSELEDYVRKPKTSGILLLMVTTWAATTRLYKTVAETGLQIDCKTPGTAAVAKWIAATAKNRGAKLASGAVDQLLEIIGADLGLLDQEISKLSLIAGPGGEITPEMVKDTVGGWRARTGWEMLDAACEGRTADALQQLDRLILAGEHPIAILGQIAFTLRMLARATRLYIAAQGTRQPLKLSEALTQAGCRPFVIRQVEPRLMRLGRTRGGQIYRWLLEADLAMKGVSSAPARARLVLEKLIVRIGAPEKAVVHPGAASRAG
ncbi:MAG: DNA polymerase III subunit delta [Planctomycetes bacterium]|nr:DNA polymerase III subunit delta [Planctomycetota bacterium]